jgi:hypothetical protein
MWLIGYPFLVNVSSIPITLIIDHQLSGLVLGVSQRECANWRNGSVWLDVIGTLCEQIRSESGL